MTRRKTVPRTTSRRTRRTRTIARTSRTPAPRTRTRKPKTKATRPRPTAGDLPNGQPAEARVPVHPAADPPVADSGLPAPPGQRTARNARPAAAPRHEGEIVNDHADRRRTPVALGTRRCPRHRPG